MNNIMLQLPYLGICTYIHALHMVAPTHASIQPHGMGNTPHALYARSQPSCIWSLWFKWHLHGRLQYTCPLATLHIDRVRLHTQPATLDTFTISIRTWHLQLNTPAPVKRWCTDGHSYSAGSSVHWRVDLCTHSSLVSLGAAEDQSLRRASSSTVSTRMLVGELRWGRPITMWRKNNEVHIL